MSNSCSLLRYFICPVYQPATTNPSIVAVPVPGENTTKGQTRPTSVGISESKQTCPFRYSLCFNHTHAAAIQAARAKIQKNQVL